MSTPESQVTTASRIDYDHDPEAPPATNIIPAASVVVVDNQDQVLMVRRSDNGHWAIPGGGMELGESLADAARREVTEETGLIVELTGIVGTFADPQVIVQFPDGEVRQEFSVVYSGRPVGGHISPSDETNEVRWFSLEDALKLPMTRPHRGRLLAWKSGHQHLG